MVKLGVNVDHIATLREARKERNPDPVAGAMLAELAGAHGITAHLREDRRHMQERDLRLLRQTVSTHLNLEMAPSPEMVQFALELLPDMVTLVPERRQELTTEGGLDVLANEKNLESAIAQLRAQHIHVSLFIDPEASQVRASQKVGANLIELHTGHFSRAWHAGTGDEGWIAERARLVDATALGRRYGLRVNAGHGLDYQNVGAVASIEGIEELNIGHSIVGRALMTGMERAVKEMLEAMREGLDELRWSR
jgi:pyridoxine 5-phosphate synthase